MKREYGESIAGQRSFHAVRSGGSGAHINAACLRSVRELRVLLMERPGLALAIHPPKGVSTGQAPGRQEQQRRCPVRGGMAPRRSLLRPHVRKYPGVSSAAGRLSVPPAHLGEPEPCGRPGRACWRFVLDHDLPYEQFIRRIPRGRFSRCARPNRDPCPQERFVPNQCPASVALHAQSESN